MSGWAVIIQLMVSLDGTKGKDRLDLPCLRRDMYLLLSVLLILRALDCARSSIIYFLA